MIFYQNKHINKKHQRRDHSCGRPLPQAPYIFLQADPAGNDLLRGFLPHIPVMPWFIDRAGDLRLIRRVAFDKSVLPAVLGQP